MSQSRLFEDRYKIFRTLCTQGDYRIYQAEDTDYSQLCAITEIHLGQTASEALMQNYSILNGHGHYALPVYYEGFEKDGYFYLVQTLQPGELLSDFRYGKNQNRELLAVNWMRQLCGALAAVRGLRFTQAVTMAMHNNTLYVEENGSVRLLHIAFGPQNFQGQGIALGMQGVMAPEEFYNQYSDVRSDIYRIGAIFYTLFSPETVQSLKGHQQPLLPIGCTNALAERLYVMVQKNPEHRYQMPQELYMALEGLDETVVKEQQRFNIQVFFFIGAIVLSTIGTLKLIFGLRASFLWAFKQSVGNGVEDLGVSLLLCLMGVAFSKGAPEMSQYIVVLNAIRNWLVERLPSGAETWLPRLKDSFERTPVDINQHMPK